MKPEVNHLWIGRENPLRTPYGFHRPFVASRPPKKTWKNPPARNQSWQWIPWIPKISNCHVQFMAFQGKSMKYNEIILQYRKHLTRSPSSVRWVRWSFKAQPFLTVKMFMGADGSLWNKASRSASAKITGTKHQQRCWLVSEVNRGTWIGHAWCSRPNNLYRPIINHSNKVKACKDHGFKWMKFRGSRRSRWALSSSLPLGVRDVLYVPWSGGMKWDEVGWSHPSQIRSQTTGRKNHIK